MVHHMIRGRTAARTARAIRRVRPKARVHGGLKRGGLIRVGSLRSPTKTSARGRADRGEPGSLKAAVSFHGAEEVCKALPPKGPNRGPRRSTGKAGPRAGRRVETFCLLARLGSHPCARASRAVLDPTGLRLSTRSRVCHACR